MDYFFAKSGAARRAASSPSPIRARRWRRRRSRKASRHIFHGDPAIGGRYSVLSKFGLIPAAAMGVDIERLLDETRSFMRASDAFVPPAANPGMRLGIALGVLASQIRARQDHHRHRAAVASVGLWLEQLIAESTGKQGKGLIPIDAEPLGEPALYGNDRVFVQIAMGESDAASAISMRWRRRAIPSSASALPTQYQLGQVFFLCEVAIAMAGAVIGINPFDQPDVEAAKVKARELTDAFEKNGATSEEQPVFSHDGVARLRRSANAQALGRANTPGAKPEGASRSPRRGRLFRHPRFP